jgi:hypothetical protein
MEIHPVVVDENQAYCQLLISYLSQSGNYHSSGLQQANPIAFKPCLFSKKAEWNSIPLSDAKITDRFYVKSFRAQQWDLLKWPYAGPRVQSSPHLPKAWHAAQGPSSVLPCFLCIINRNLKKPWEFIGSWCSFSDWKTSYSLYSMRLFLLHGFTLSNVWSPFLPILRDHRSDSPLPLEFSVSG